MADESARGRSAGSGCHLGPTSTVQPTDLPLPPRRWHKKSRLGCSNCKVRKVKCDEGRPTCRACRIRQTRCEYPPVTPRKRPSSSSSPAVSAARPPSPRCAARAHRLVYEPLYCLPSRDALDMRLLWFYTATTHKSLSFPDAKQRPMDHVLQTVVMQHAFGAPFLLDAILELASWHMHVLGQGSPEPARAMLYRARSLRGYRQAIDDAHPSVHGALLASSVLRPLLATRLFGESPDSSGELYLVDWMVLWRGVQSIVHLTGAPCIQASGMGPLFARPRMPLLDVSAAAIPKELLLLVSAVGRDDPDAAEIPTYHDGLRALGYLFDSLRRGLDSVMLPRVVTWGTMELNRLVDLARVGKPRALVILAHYAVFLKLLQDIWWLAGVGERSIRAVCHALGPEWRPFLSLPLSALLAESTADLTRVLLAAVQ